MKKLLIALCSTLLIANISHAATPTLDDLYKTIQKQQTEIDALKASSSEQEERLELTADEIEKNMQAADGTQIHGYAEMHYQDLNNGGSSGHSDDVNALDFHRFVLYVSHEFNDKTQFISEFEIEHSTTGEGAEEKGEVALEQGYIEHDITSSHHIKAGLFLLPIGFLNETHEPNAFYGVERNNVERNIIPTTWNEGGLAYSGETSIGLSYDVALTSGLYLDTSLASGAIRDGRQHASNARADDFGTTIRVKYTGLAGLELGMSIHHENDLTQGDRTDSISAVLYEAHTAYQIQNFSVRALYAAWNIDKDINTVQSGTAKQKGFYIEPSYKVNDDWGFFARVSEWDNQADDKIGSAMMQTDLGVNYWLNPNVTLKFDYQDQNAEDNNAAKERDGINLGIGLSF